MIESKEHPTPIERVNPNRQAFDRACDHALWVLANGRQSRKSAPEQRVTEKTDAR